MMAVMNKKIFFIPKPLLMATNHLLLTVSPTDSVCPISSSAETAMMWGKQNRYNSFYVSALHFRTVSVVYG